MRVILLNIKEKLQYKRENIGRPYTSSFVGHEAHTMSFFKKEVIKQHGEMKRV